MFSTLRTRFGIPGVISVIALVFAMFGGAYAASNSSGGPKATASAKAKKGPRGPKGATGPAGPAGAQGPAGPKGDAGAAGSNGTNGSPGSPGEAGKSVKSESFEGTNEPAGEPCAEQGGNSFEVEGAGVKHYACNGTAGTNGSPWTAGGTLPVGATETGTWSFMSLDPSEESAAYAPISFPVPLAAELNETHVALASSDPVHCAGSFFEPTAASGYLCIYPAGVFKAAFREVDSLSGLSAQTNPVEGIPGASTSGAIVIYTVFGKEALEGGFTVRGAGSFAVTG
jgi:hypothetical protein